MRSDGNGNRQGSVDGNTDRVRIEKIEVLHDEWSKLKRATLQFLRRDGTWQQLIRETYDRGDGVVALLYDHERGTVLLIRQFRWPVHAHGGPSFLIEACAGKADGLAPEVAMRHELAQELGVEITGELTRVMEAYMSPGSVTEKLSFFVAPYTPASRTAAGGGLVEEGEDIESLELPFTEALAMIDRGEIMDGKTIMLLLYAQWKRLLS